MATSNATAAFSAPTSSFPTIFETITSDARYRQLAWHLLIITPIALRFGPRYFHPTLGAKRARLFNYNGWLPLVSHILVAFTIIVRFQYRILNTPQHLYPSAGPLATTTDLALGLTSATQGWMLARRNSKGNTRIVRTGFQALALHIALCAVMGYATQEPGWLDAMVKDHNSFSYVRLVLVFDKIVGFMKGPSERYTMALYTGLLVAAAEGNTPKGMGVPLYLMGMVGMLAIQKWISGMITPKNAKSNPFLRLCLYIGLVDYDTYGMLKEAGADEGQKVAKNEAVKAD